MKLLVLGHRRPRAALVSLPLAEEDFEQELQQLKKKNDRDEQIRKDVSCTTGPLSIMIQGVH